MRRLPMLVLPFLGRIKRGVPSTLVTKSATVVLVVGALAAIAVLVIGLLVMEQRRGATASTQQAEAIETEDVMEFLARFASDRGYAFDGPCRGDTPTRSLCYVRIEELPGARQVTLRDMTVILQYVLLIESDGSGGVRVASVTGPDRFTIEPPTTGPSVSPPPATPAVIQPTPGSLPPGAIPPPNP